MKKALVVLLASLMTFSISATTDNLTVNGVVPSELALAVRAKNKASNLDLSASPVDLKIATVIEKSNSSTGYKISAKSQNGSLLKNGSVDQLGYLVSYDGGSKTTLTTTDQVLKTVNTAGAYNYRSDLNITYTGKPSVEMVEGTYTDSITFTITAN